MVKDSTLAQVLELGIETTFAGFQELLGINGSIPGEGTQIYAGGLNYLSTDQSRQSRVEEEIIRRILTHPMMNDGSYKGIGRETVISLDGIGKETGFYYDGRKLQLASMGVD